MVKNILTFSMVASLTLFTAGCGGGGSSNQNQTQQMDTTAPAFTNTTSVFKVTEETNSSVTLSAADNSAVTFSINPTPHFLLNNDTLTFSAPVFEDNSSNEYNISVTAKDTSANATDKVFSFIVEPKKASSQIVSVGDKNLTVNGDKIIGPAGLEWLNDNAGAMTYAEAVQYCKDADNGSGFRVPRRDEVLNLMDYTTDDGRTLENEFSATKSVSWAQEVNDTYFMVNLNSGADGEVSEDDVNNGTKTYSVLCVKGRSADPHTFVVSETNNSVVIDQTTNMAWTKATTDNDATRRAIDPDANIDPTVNPQKAEDFCPTGYTLPNIAELRSLVDYSQNTVNTEIIPPVGNKIIIVWSDTKDLTDNTGIDKNFHINATDKGIISTDAQTESFFITCVKKQ